MKRYDLTDFEWSVIEPLLPNRPRGVPRVDVVKPPPARRSGSVAGVTGACVCDGSGVKWLRVG